MSNIKFNELQNQIISEICKSASLYGAKSDLLGSIASWGDTQTDKETLANIQLCNLSKETEIKGRLESTNNL